LFYVLQLLLAEEGASFIYMVPNLLQTIQGAMFFLAAAIVYFVAFKRAPKTNQSQAFDRTGLILIAEALKQSTRLISSARSVSYCRFFFL
jgi:hypothetical protein